MGDKSTQGTILMCPPTYFEICYVINPWMVNQQVDPERAAVQWRELHTKLHRLNVAVELIDPAPGLPDMTFAGDGGVAFRRRFVSSNFRHAERQAEAKHYESWFAQRGYEIYLLPDSVLFEGLGDVTLSGGYGITSYGQRTSEDAVPHLERIFPEVTWLASLELVDPRFFHIGVALQLLDGQTGMYVPDAFSAAGRREIEALPHRMIPVTDEDAAQMTVNAIVLQRDLVVNHCSPQVREQLQERGFNVHVVNVSEFLTSVG